MDTEFSFWLSLIVLAGLLLLPTTKGQMRAVDWGMLILVAFESVVPLLSQYRANSVRTSILVTVSAVMFFAVRLTVRRPIQIACLCGVFGISGTYLGSKGIAGFGAAAGRLTEAGLSNLLAFRSRLINPPAPWVEGEWFTVVLLALPFACALPLYLWRRERKWFAFLGLLPPLVVTVALTLSLSRAVFWSTILFFFSLSALLVLSKTTSTRGSGVLLLGAVGGVVLILTLDSVTCSGLFRAYTGEHTSQTRSTQGRVEIWNRSMEVVRAHPVLGVGSSNAALMLLSSTDDEETTGFASRTFSLPIQILVEKGIIGFLLYLVFLGLVAREFVKTVRHPCPCLHTKERCDEPNHHVAKKAETFAEGEPKQDSIHKAMACCFAAGLVAVLFRELTYSSLLEHSLTMALYATLAALVCRPEVAQFDT